MEQGKGRYWHCHTWGWATGVDGEEVSGSVERFSEGVGGTEGSRVLLVLQADPGSVETEVLQGSGGERDGEVAVNTGAQQSHSSLHSWERIKSHCWRG